MPRHPVELGSRMFPSKAIAKTYIRTEILNGYPLRRPIDNAEHIEVLLDVLRRKPNAAEKIGDGIDHFYVDSTSRFRNYVRPDAKTIVIHRVRGEDVDFGYERVIDGSSDIDYAKEALRFEIEDLRDAFKFSRFDNGVAFDEETGDEIADHSEAEVRYREPSWGRLTADFAESIGGWGQIQTHSGDGQAQIGRRLTSPEIRVAWREYWSGNANPVLVHKHHA